MCGVNLTFTMKTRCYSIWLAAESNGYSEMRLRAACVVNKEPAEISPKHDDWSLKCLYSYDVFGDLKVFWGFATTVCWYILLTPSCRLMISYYFAGESFYLFLYVFPAVLHPQDSSLLTNISLFKSFLSSFFSLFCFTLLFLNFTSLPDYALISFLPLVCHSLWN